MHPRLPTAPSAPRAEHSDEALRDFSRSLPMAMLRAREAVMARFRPMLLAHGLTEQQWRVVRALTSAQSPLRSNELGELTFLSAPSLTRILKTLEARDLIHRVVHQKDQRAAQLSLTDAGLALFRAIAPHSEASYAEIAQSLGSQHLDDLYQLLGEVVTKLTVPGVHAQLPASDD